MHPSKRQSAVQHTLFALLLSLIAWASGLHAELAVSLSAPANNSRYSAPATIPLQAEISVSGSSSVSQVAFYQGNTLIGSTTSSPYQWTWDNVAAGNYRLTAQATDADGSIVSSGAINLQVGLPGTQVFYIHSDHLNTPRLVTDEQNTVVWRNLPLGEPFGLSPPEEDPDGNGVPFVLNLRFPGQYYDKETNLHYNYYRDYDAATGRYVQSDPIGLRGGINTYSYVGGNPVSRIDPTGESWVIPIGLTLIYTGAVAAGVLPNPFTSQMSGKRSSSDDLLGGATGASRSSTGAPDPCQIAPELCGGQDQDSGGIVPGRPEIPRGGQLVRRDVRNVKSAEFREYCEQNNVPGKNWNYAMETWRAPDGRLIERHYWVHPSGRAFWHK